MRKSLLPLLATAMLVVSCSEAQRVDSDALAEREVANPALPEDQRPAGSASERPVRIGEGGPRFDACQAVGRVQGRGSLDVLVAPFDAAEQKASIGEGQLVYICTRSHDQQWFGIVYDDAAPEVAEGEAEAAAASGAGDCGVSSPVRSKRNYDGPCKSGWVESTFVKLVAG